MPEKREISFSSKDDASVIRIQFIDNVAKAIRPEEARAWLRLKEGFSSAKLTDEPELTALSSKAVSCDLEWVQGTVSRSGRFSRVPLARGCIDFSLVTGPESFAEHLPVLNQLMLSLRTAPLGGRIQVRAVRPE